MRTAHTPTRRRLGLRELAQGCSRRRRARVRDMMPKVSPSTIVPTCTHRSEALPISLVAQTELAQDKRAFWRPDPASSRFARWPSLAGGLRPPCAVRKRKGAATIARGWSGPVDAAYQIKGRLILTDANAFLVFGYRNICLFEIIAFQRS